VSRLPDADETALDAPQASPTAVRRMTCLWRSRVTYAERAASKCSCAHRVALSLPWQAPSGGSSRSCARTTSEEEQLLQSSPSAYAVAPLQQRGNKDTDLVHAPGPPGTARRVPGGPHLPATAAGRTATQTDRCHSNNPTAEERDEDSAQGGTTIPIAPGSGGAITPRPRQALSRVSDQMTSSAINYGLPGGAISARSLLAA
jgi:hypothetical protein